MPKKAGSVPFQIIDGIVRVCLVSSKRRKDKFVLPKGNLRALETSYAAAKRETMEEAGLKGVMSRRSVKIKVGSNDPDKKSNTIKFFAMYVDEISDHWPEEKSRERLWVDLEDLPKTKMVKRDIIVLKSKKMNTIIRSYKKKFAA